MTLDELKNHVKNYPEQIEICWDKLDEDIKYKEEFENVVTAALSTIPTMESIYNKLTANKSVLVAGMDTALKRDEVENYLDVLEDELFAAYQIQIMWETYQKVQDVINV